MSELRQSTTFVIVRGDDWQNGSASEPYEAGWATEALIFLRILKPLASDAVGEVRLEISPDGMHWAFEGTSIPLPADLGQVTFGRLRHFGNWLRLRADFSDPATVQLLATLHLKA